jgi:hypothetical protein
MKFLNSIDGAEQIIVKDTDNKIIATEVEGALKESFNKIGTLFGVKLSIGTSTPTDTLFWLDTSVE